jgi:hypothetical protein
MISKSVFILLNTIGSLPDRPGDPFVLADQLFPYRPYENGQFGASLHFFNNSIIIGGPRATFSSGSAYIFYYSPGANPPRYASCLSCSLL